MAITDQVKRAWNAFRSNEQTSVQQTYSPTVGVGSTINLHRERTRFYNDKSIVSAIFTRLSIDVAGIDIRHVKLDEQGRYSEEVSSALNQCLTLEPNMDQSPRSFRQDIAMTLFDEGVAAIVPVDTNANPSTNGRFDIYTLRVGAIKEWYPKHVKVSLYNEAKGIREEILLEKRFVSIVENPLYSVMNEPNSTLQRLIRKLQILDVVDEQSGSGKLDLIIQLPYVIKSEARRMQAEKRRDDIEFQLKGSQYGIAYTDGTEKITQLNRPAENNLLGQVEYLTKMLYSQLGLTEEVFNGTADEKSMINYTNRTLEPILDAIVQGMQRSFLGVLGTRRNERIKYFQDPFKLVPLSEIAEIADKFSRNEIFSSNEIRGFMGFAPSKDPKADSLVNSNMPQNNAPPGPSFKDVDKVMNDVFDGLGKDIDNLVKGDKVEDKKDAGG